MTKKNTFIKVVSLLMTALFVWSVFAMAAPVISTAVNQKLMRDTKTALEIKGDGWELYEDGNLVIRKNIVASNGAMPWAAYVEKINRVSILGDQVTVIADGTFQDINIDTLYIPASVQSLSKNAFGLDRNGYIEYVETIYFGGTKAVWETMDPKIEEVLIRFEHAHKNDVLLNNVTPSCVDKKDGYTGDYYCTECNALSKEGEVLPYNNDSVHKYGKTKVVVKAATCAEEGIKAYVCSLCGTQKDLEPIAKDMDKHQFEIVRSELPCGDPNAQYYEKCTICGREKTPVDCPADHEFEHVTIPATCTENGEEKEQCKYCVTKKDSHVGELAKGHDFRTITIEPTCTEPGRIYEKCERCDFYEQLKVIPVHTLGYYETKNVHKDPTCIAEGSDSVVCAKCGATMVDDHGDKIVNPLPINPDAHEPGEWETVVEPTCIKDGQEKKVCQLCKTIVDLRTLVALGHDWNYIQTADCTDGGGKAIKVCSRRGCGERVEIDVPAREQHEIQVIVTSPTCTEKGYSREICKVEGCGYESEKFAIHAALGHDYREIVKEPTCILPGERKWVCSRCGDVLKTEILSALGHDYEHITRPSSCTQTGKEYDRCTRCGKVINDVQIPIIDHKMILDKEHSTQPTCTKWGRTFYICSVCGHGPVEDFYHTDKDNMAPTGHNYKGVVTPPTCTAKGYTTYTCSACGDTYKDNYTNMTPHNYEVISTIPVTCTTDGYSNLKCKDCGATATGNYVHAPGHIYKNYVTPPTCKDTGYTTHICDVCGSTYIDTPTAKTPHNFGDEVITTEATAFHDGVRTKTCKTCGFKVETPYKLTFLQKIAWFFRNIFSTIFGVFR